jgi:hypothetical protein
MQMPVANWSVGGFSADNGTAESAAAAEYTNKIKLVTVQTPFPRPLLRPWNGSNCGSPNMPKADPTCVDTPEWNDVLPGPNGTVHGFSALCWYVYSVFALLFFSNIFGTNFVRFGVHLVFIIK